MASAGESWGIELLMFWKGVEGWGVGGREGESLHFSLLVLWKRKKSSVGISV